MIHHERIHFLGVFGLQRIDLCKDTHRGMKEQATSNRRALDQPAFSLAQLNYRIYFLAYQTSGKADFELV